MTSRGERLVSAANSALRRMGGLAGNVNLCSHRFSPVRDPQRFPVCPRCKELAGMLGIGR
jgi:hypothetical protein